MCWLHSCRRSQFGPLRPSHPRKTGEIIVFLLANLCVCVTGADGHCLLWIGFLGVEKASMRNKIFHYRLYSFALVLDVVWPFSPENISRLCVCGKVLCSPCKHCPEASDYTTISGNAVGGMISVRLRCMGFLRCMLAPFVAVGFDNIWIAPPRILVEEREI